MSWHRPFVFVDQLRREKKEKIALMVVYSHGVGTVSHVCLYCEWAFHIQLLHIHILLLRTPNVIVLPNGFHSYCEY